ETANPQRMGAALTYARRYALFTLVGIAGEDDLDAPDLCESPKSPSSSALGDSQIGVRAPGAGGNGRVRGGTRAEPRAVLNPEQSAEVRDQWVAELAAITSPELAATWARQALAAKNSLTEKDAKLVEVAFERRLSELMPAAEPAQANDGSSTIVINEA